MVLIENTLKCWCEARAGCLSLINDEDAVKVSSRPLSGGTEGRFLRSESDVKASDEHSNVRNSQSVTSDQIAVSVWVRELHFIAFSQYGS